MKKKDYESLGALQKMIYDFLSESFKKGEYEIELDNYYYGVSEYVGGNLIIGGYKFNCSVNKKNFICWHCDYQLELLLRNVPKLTDTICRKVKAIIREKAVNVKNLRIKELEQELKKLKGE